MKSNRTLSMPTVFTRGKSNVIDAEERAQREHHLAAQRSEANGNSAGGEARRPFKKKRAPFRPAEGHEISLATYIKHKNRLRLTLHYDGVKEVVEGAVTAFDRYTVSILVEGEREPRIYFKSNILFFQRAEDC